MLLEKILEKNGFRVSKFEESKTVLDSAVLLKPDLVLMDIVMPDIDGYKLCQAFKSTPELSKIPVIFISAKSRVSDMKEGFDNGGVDYINKPFQAEEVVLWVNNHLLIRNLQKELEDQNRQLEIKVQQRTAALAAALKKMEKLDDIKSDFLRFISHEMRTPLNGLIGVMEILVNRYKDELDTDFQLMFNRSKYRTMSLIDDALLLNEIESFPQYFESKQVQLKKVPHNAIQAADLLNKAPLVKMPELDGLDIRISGEPEVLTKAFTYLLLTASNFSEEDRQLEIGLKLFADRTVIQIDAFGKTFAGDTADSFFDFFSDVRSSSYAESMGLVPVVAGRVISLFEGAVTVFNTGQSGVRFEVEFPL